MNRSTARDNFGASLTAHKHARAEPDPRPRLSIVPWTASYEHPKIQLDTSSRCLSSIPTSSWATCWSLRPPSSPSIRACCRRFVVPWSCSRKRCPVDRAGARSLRGRARLAR